MVQETEQTETEATGPRGSFTVQSIVAIVVALIVLAGGGVFLATRGDNAPSPATSTTAGSRRSTTTTVEKLPPGTYEIATVKKSVDRVKVLSQPPEGWLDSSESVIPTAMVETPPASQDAAPKRPPIPAANDPVVGRYVVDDGWEFKNPGPYDPPQPMTFLVTDRRGEWLEVMLPVRPNGTHGYVKTNDVELRTSTKRIEVHVAEHKLVAYDGDDVVVDSPIVTGVSFSPTPTGVFYVTDTVPYKNPNGFYGPFALATNGYSEFLNEFDNGAPVLAIHGTNKPELLGQDRSNGCIRLPNDVVTKLADQMGLGTPVLIWP